MRKKIIFIVLLFYFLTFLSAFVMAEETQVPEMPDVQTQEEEQKKVPSFEENKVIFKEPPTKESPQHWGLTFMGGTYRPSNYTGSGDPFGVIYSGQAQYIGNQGLWADLS